ncbi:MAG: flavodoxin family protein [Methanococcaceae archaeon]
MKKTLITYISQTGNTRKVAESIFQAIPGNKELKKLTDINSLDEYDLIFIGFPIYNFEPIREAKDFIKNRLHGKKIAIFMTMSLTSAPSCEEISGLYKMTISNCRECADGANILGIFDSPGELSEKTASALLKSDDPQLRMFGMMRNYSIGFPNEKNLSDAKFFAKEIYSRFELACSGQEHILSSNKT